MLKGLTNTFKQGCNDVELVYKEYIVLDEQTIPVKATLKDDCYENGNFIGTFILKEIQFETEATYEFRNKEFEYYKEVNGESIKIGTFISTDITINDTTEIVKVVGMDYGLKTQVEYKSTLDYASGTITLMDVWNECCQLSGLESGINSFTNSDFIVDSDQFSQTGATIRDVFKGIAMSSGTFVKVMNDDKIYLIFNENTQDVIEDYVELEDKRDTHPWTCLRLGMSQIEGENVDYIDEELVEEYGENWLILNDNPFAYNQEKREQLIENIFNQIKEFGYSAFVSKISFKPYFTCGDVIEFKNRDGDLVKSIILRYTHSGEQITLEAPSETSSVVNYVYPLTAIDMNKRTQIEVDKDKVRIDSLTSQTSSIQSDLQENYYTITQTNELVQNAQTGLTNTFSEAGGNNIFRNTGLWFEAESVDESATVSSSDGVIEINNGDDKNIKDMTLYGNTYQYTTTGKNLGKHIAGFINGSGVFKDDTDDSFYFPVQAGETFTCVGLGNRHRIAIFNSVPENNLQCIDGTATTDLADNTPFTVSASGYAVIYAQTPTSETVKNSFMVVKGTTTGDYEPYTGGVAAPNPDFPMPVQTVTGRQEIDVVERNLLNNVATTQEVNGITFTVNEDKSITMSGTASADAYLYLLGNTTDTLTLEAGTYTRYASSDGNDITGIILQCRKDSVSGTDIFGNANVGIRTTTLTETTKVVPRLRVINGTQISTPITIYPMIIKGNYTIDTIPSYEPYKRKSYEINLGKNLLPFPYKDTTKTVNGITFTVNNDGTINVNGTATANATFKLLGDESDQYNLTGNYITGGINSNVIVRVVNNTNWNYTILATSSGSPSQINKSTYTTGYIELRVANGTTVNNQIVKPMMTANSDNIYSPYKTPIELCKIGNYQDFIRKGTGKNLFSGTSVTTQSTYMCPCKAGDIFTLSFIGKCTASDKRVFLRTYDGEFSTNLDARVDNVVLTLTSDYSSYSATITSTIDGFVYLRTATGTSPYSFSNMQLEKSSTVSPYEPYGFKDKWYSYKAIGKVVLDGSETINYRSAGRFDIEVPSSAGTYTIPSLCDDYTYTTNWDTHTSTNGTFTFQNINWGANKCRMSFKNTSYNSLSDVQTGLATNNITLYYAITSNLGSPTTTEITDEELINQIESIQTIEGYNNITLLAKDVDTEFDLTYLIEKKIYEFWDGNVAKLKEDKASNSNALLLQQGTLSQNEEVPNGKHTVSFKYKKLIELADVKAYINGIEYELDSTEDKEFMEVIDVNTKNINVSFTTDINNSCEIYDLMVNAGEVKLAYSQNQNETTTSTVNISKGITITSSDNENVKFKADFDGIRTLDKNDVEITKFTDTGLTTKEATITGKSQIVGTLWQEVGEQTWITRL